MSIVKKTKFLIGLFMLSTLLSACSGMFKPKHKTIEYDEEVKLHDGSMIWVHIKRHYVLSGGGALGDPGAFEMNYYPTAVEVSWDTGFKGVGRKSVFFNEYIGIIDKYNDKWYLIGEGSKNRTLPNSISSEEVGFSIDGRQVVVVNQRGQFIKPNNKEINLIDKTNVFLPYFINGWGKRPFELNGKKINWQEKLSLETHQRKDYQSLEKSIFPWRK